MIDDEELAAVYVYMTEIGDIAKNLAHVVESVEDGEELSFEHPEYGLTLKKVHDDCHGLANKYDIEFQKIYDDMSEIAAITNIKNFLDSM